MRRRASTEVPRALDPARREIGQWRGRQSGRWRVPRELWAKAVALVEDCGVHRTARTVGVKYASLRQHLAVEAGDAAQAPAARYQFLKLRPGPLTAPSLAWTIELEEGHGATLRTHMQGATMADLAAFAQRLRSGQA